MALSYYLERSNFGLGLSIHQYGQFYRFVPFKRMEDGKFKIEIKQIKPGSFRIQTYRTIHIPFDEYDNKEILELGLYIINTHDKTIILELTTKALLEII